MMLTLLSCFVFSACGDKYKKLSMSFYEDGRSVSSINLMLEEENDFQDEIEIGVKFSGIKQKYIDDVIFEFPNAIGLLSNQRQEGKYVYVTLTVNTPIEESENVYLKAIHVASGKSKSVKVTVSQKSNDIQLLNQTYIISIPSVGTNSHEIDVAKIVKLLPEGSSDDVMFAQTAVFDKNKFVPIMEGDYIKGFTINSSITPGDKIEGLYPITLINGEVNKEYKDKKFDILFIPTLNSENLEIISDAKHMSGNHLYEPIYLIANDTSTATGDYNYNNFYVQLRYGETVLLDKFINGYNYSEYYDVELIGCSNISLLFNEDKTRVYIQAKNMNSNVEQVEIKFLPKNCVGDILPFSLKINVKADIKPTAIDLRKGMNLVEKVEGVKTVDIYDVYTGNLGNQMLEFTPELRNSLNDLKNMRIKVTSSMLNVLQSGITNSVNKVYTDDTFLVEKEDVASIINFRRNEKLLSFYKNGSSDTDALRFYYDSVSNVFISETITYSDKVFVKYVPSNLPVNQQHKNPLEMTVFNYYSGNHEYLKAIECVEEIISFNSIRGVKATDIGVGVLTNAGGLTYTQKIANPTSVYLDKKQGDASYALKINKVTGVDSEILETTFNVSVEGKNNQTNLIGITSASLSGNVYNFVKANDIEKYLIFNLSGCETGEYLLKIKHDSGYEYELNVFVYDSREVDNPEFVVSGNYIKNKISDGNYLYSDTYGDYIVASTETLTFEVGHDVPKWFIDSYVFTATIDGASANSYCNLTYNDKIATFKCLKGSYDNGIKKIVLKSKIVYKTAASDLQLTVTNDKEIQTTIFIYEKIKESDISINISEIEVYSYDMLGVYDKNDSQVELRLTLNNSNLWNYIQKGTQNYADHKIGFVATPDKEKEVVWYVANDNYETMSTISQSDRDVKLQFSGTDVVVPYDVIIRPRIVQFDNTFENLSCVVHVREPEISSSIDVEFTKDDKDIKVKNNVLNIRDGLTYKMKVKNVSNSSLLTNHGSVAIVVNKYGDVVDNVVSLNYIDIEDVWEIELIDSAVLRDDLRLVVFAKDALKKVVMSLSSGLTTEGIINEYMIDGKRAYEEYTLSLSNGTIENRYWIESADDFWEIANNDTLKSKHFVLKNNINLKNTNYAEEERIAIDNFSGSITTYNKVEIQTQAELDDGTYYVIDGGIFKVETSYYADKTYYENVYHSIYGAELSKDRINLFETLSGNIVSVNFIAKYDYDMKLENNINLGIIGLNVGVLTNVTAEVSGGAKIDSDYYVANFGGLVGYNKRIIDITDRVLVGVSGKIDLENGTADVYFGSVAGMNEGSITGVIAEEHLTEHQFVVAFADQGAISNLTIKSSISGDNSTTIGGVVGYNKGKLTNIYATGSINARDTNNVGGIVGKNETTATRATVNYDGGNYDGITLDNGINKFCYDLVNIKSSVIILAKNNVGGIVGLDNGGNYYHCIYQVVSDVAENGIKANENVGGIAGSSAYGKFIFCSVYGYRWDYSDLDTTFEDDKADIYGQNNVGAIVGNAESKVATDPISDTDLLIIKQSSTNAFVESEEIVGALVGSANNNIPVESVYFMGKLVGTTINKFDNKFDNTIELKYYYYDESNNTGDNPNGDGWKEDNDPNKKVNYGMNYLVMPNADETYSDTPIFDLAPTSVSATAKDSAGNVIKVDDAYDAYIHIDYYQSKLSVLDPEYQEEQEKYDADENTYDFASLFDFVCVPEGSYRFKVVSSNTQVAEILDNGKLRINGVGIAEITFVSVLNSKARCTVKIEVNYPMNDAYLISNSTMVEPISSDSIITGQAKLYYVHENSDKFYKTNTDLGYKVKIELKSGYLPDGKVISDYIKVSNTEYVENMRIAPGRKLSIELKDTIDVIFNVYITPFVLIGDKDIEKDSNILEFGEEYTFELSTKQGVSDINLNYKKIILYPNDEILINAIFTTDKELQDGDVNSIFSSNPEKYVNVEFIKLGDFEKPADASIGTQTATYKVQISDSAKYIDNEDGENEDGEIDVTITFKIEGIESSANFTVRAQKIDNIDIKNYATSKPNPNVEEYTIDSLSRILRPNYAGLLVLDVVPSNGIYKYLEITDITGSEEIIFAQVEFNCDHSGCGLGDHMEGHKINGEEIGSTPIEKGIRLVGKSSRHYVMTRISADYTSRIHTIKVTARNEEGVDIGTTYYYIDVKMMPSITMKYYDPNGIETAVSTNNDSQNKDLDSNKLYLANGVSSVDFYITTKNSDGNVDISLDFESGAEDVNQYFEMKKAQKDHYELNFKKYDSSIVGRTLIITATTRATMDNGVVEYESTTFKFVITDFVIHNISVNNSVRSNPTTYDYQIYGDYSIPVQLQFYFDETDISYYNNGAPHTQVYEFNSPEYLSNVDQSTVLGQIYKILKALNEVETDGGDFTTSYVKLYDGENKKDFNLVVDKQIAIVEGERNGQVVDSVTLTRDKIQNTLTLKVEESENTDNSSMKLMFNYDYIGGIKNYDNSAENEVKFNRNYKFKFTNRTSLFNMTSINNEEEFLTKMTSGDSGYYILNADLELGKYNTYAYEKFGAYSPINVDIDMFDGNGHTITIYSFAEFAEETIQAGLFKEIKKDMIVMNLNVRYVTQHDGAGNYSFGLVNKNNTVYSDICSIDDKLGIDYKAVQFGGISPLNNGIITNCKVSGTIAMHASTLENSENTTKDIDFNIGGLVGTNDGYITNSVSELQVYALANIGGLVFKNGPTGKIASSYFNAQIGKGLIDAYPDVENEKTSAIEVRVAGFVVDNAGQISMSYTHVGTNSINGDGSLSCKDSSAGFVYSNTGKIKDCYVQQGILGASQNTYYGFVYNNSGEISTSYTYINEGKWSDSVRLFAGTNTRGLIDCIEFINGDEGYTISSAGLSSINLITKNFDEINLYKDRNFNFGDNENSVWTIKPNELPKLVSTLETATGYRLVENITETKVDENGREYEETRTEVSENGYGNKENPYVIYDLATWNAYVKVKKDSPFDDVRSYYRFVSDIDFSSISMTLPTSNMTFAGNIQGNNMTISGYTIYSDKKLSSIGLFKDIVDSGAREITPAIRNLNISAYSVSATKTEVVGVLAGYIENYHLYNLSVDCDAIVLGGNIVGGLAGVIGGNIDIENITSSVSVSAEKRTAGGIYDMYISKVNGAEQYQGIQNVTFAGSVAGIVDVFDNSSTFNVANRNIESNLYKVIRNVKVNGEVTVIGENVGGMFGFLGERVKLENATIEINNGKLTATRQAGMIAAENRGVIKNVLCISQNEKLFDDPSVIEGVSDFVFGGAVGLNFGGYIENVNVSVDIVFETRSNTVGGIVGRNVGGTINDVVYDGKLFANVIGGIVGVENNIMTLKQSGILTNETIEYVFDGYSEYTPDPSVPEELKIHDVEYYGVTKKYNNCSISIDTFNYWLERMDKIYKYTVDINNNLQVSETRCLGLFVGRGEVNSSKIFKKDIQSFVDGNLMKFLTFETDKNSITVEKLSKYPKGDEEWEKSIEDAKLSSRLNYTFTEMENILILDIADISSDYVKNKELYLLTLIGSSLDEYNSWSKGTVDISSRIFCLDHSKITDVKVADITPGGGAGGGGVVDPGAGGAGGGGGAGLVAPTPEEIPAGSGGGAAGAPPAIVGAELFANAEVLEKIVKGTLPDYVIDNEAELINLFNYIGYNRIKTQVNVKVSPSLNINRIADIDKYMDKITFSGYSYARGVSGDYLGIYCARDLPVETARNGYDPLYATADISSRHFSIDDNTKYPNVINQVSTSDQLVFIFENNSLKINDSGVVVAVNQDARNRPVCVSGTMADKVYKAAKNILALICTDTDSDYMKAKKIYEWIVTNVTYDNYGANNGTYTEQYRCFYAEGALIDRYAVCDGMAKAYVIMCGIEGIPCIRIDGFSSSGSGHAWNQVKLGSSWYHVDPTNNRFGWDDDAEVLGGQTYNITDIDLQPSTSAHDIFTLTEYYCGSEDILIEANTLDAIYEELCDLLSAFKNSMGTSKYGYIEFKDVANTVQLEWDTGNTDKNNIYHCFVSVFSGIGYSIRGERGYDVDGNMTVWIFEIILT